MSASYYIRSQGKVLGPFSFEDLKAKAAKGHLKKTHQISADKKTWQAARSVEGLFAAPPKLPQPVKAEPAMPVLVEPELVEVQLIEEEPLEVDAPDEETEWHYCLPGDAQTQGPVSESKLRKLFQSGRLPADTLVWNDSLGDWVEATRIRALAGAARGGGDPVVFNEVAIMDSSPAYPVPAGSHRPIPPLATVSLILGILSLVLGITGVIVSAMKAKLGFILGLFIPAGIASVLAVVFSHLSWRQIKASRKALQGQNLAKSGLILGYTVLGCLILGGGVWMIIKMTG